MQDDDSAHRLLALLRERFSTISLVWADGGDAGRLAAWATTVLRLTVTIVKRTDNTKGFVVLPYRWVVKRTFGWLTRHRRLVRDYERRPEHHEAMVWWATVTIMTRRLTPRTRVRPTATTLGSTQTNLHRGTSRMIIRQQALRRPADPTGPRRRRRSPWPHRPRPGPAHAHPELAHSQARPRTRWATPYDQPAPATTSCARMRHDPRSVSRHLRQHAPRPCSLHPESAFLFGESGP